MSLGEPHPVKLWAGIFLFFAVGAAIALTIAFRMMDRGSSVISAISMGSFAGGYGAGSFFTVLATP